jgi:DNA-binding transcriptional LysR family regulator
MGLGIGSEWVFTNELASGAVKTVLNDWTLPDQNLWAVFPTGRLIATRTREFVDFVQACLDPKLLSAAA